MKESLQSRHDHANDENRSLVSDGLNDTDGIDSMSLWDFNDTVITVIISLAALIWITLMRLWH